MGLFEKEKAIYFEILPPLVRLDRKISVPKVAYADGDTMVIIMRDLKSEGWCPSNNSSCKLSLYKS